MKLFIKKSYSSTIVLSSSTLSLLGLIVLIGWHTNTTLLIQIQKSFVPMQYNTALFFLFCGLTLFCIIKDKFFWVLSLFQKRIIAFLFLLCCLSYTGYIQTSASELTKQEQAWLKEHPELRLSFSDTFQYFVVDYDFLVTKTVLRLIENHKYEVIETAPNCQKYIFTRSCKSEINSIVSHAKSIFSINTQAQL